MKTKTVMTWLLLAFVGFSLVYMVLPKSGASLSKGATVQAASKTDYVAVYYFYDNIRCQTCKQIEANTKEVVEQDYAKEVAEGTVVWRPINTDEPGNQHYLKDYSIMSKSVIVAKFEAGKQVKWSNLKKVWQLIKDPNAYKQYLRDEINSVLGSRP